jgi:hypothetical protein
MTKQRTFKTPKGTELPLADIKGRAYLQVAHRLVWFREEHADWMIDTEIIEVNEKHAVMRAYIKDENGRQIATAVKQEDVQGFPDFIEKAETGAIGRALAMCGYGTQFTPELDEGERLADAPTQPARKATPYVVKRTPAQPATVPDKRPASPQQITLIGKLREEKLLPMPLGENLETMTSFEANTLIQKLMATPKQEPAQPTLPEGETETVPEFTDADVPQ